MNSSATIASIYSSSASPKKTASSFRLEHASTNLLAKLDNAFKKDLDSETHGYRTPYKSPRDRKKEFSPIRENTRSRTDIKSPKDVILTKRQGTKAPQDRSGTKSPTSLAQVSSDKFAPYMQPQGISAEQKLKPSSSAKKSDGQKPVKSTTQETATPNKGNVKKKDPHYFTFALGKGNNDHVVRRVMAKRFWWKETYPSNTIFDFAWHQSSRAIEFSQLHAATPLKRIVNHFEYNCEIGTKNNLIKNLQPYCEKRNIDLFKITPVTFILDLDDPYFNADYRVFSKFFKDFGKPKEEPVEENKLVGETDKAESKSRGKSYVPRISQKQLQAKLPDTYYNGTNLWLLKPADYNRGQGINLFNKLSTLEHYLKCSYKGDDKVDFNSPLKNVGSSTNIVMCHKFVVQKYIERPMLIEGRKFDARVWALIDHEMNLYMFKESYLRLSSEVFNLDETRLEDKYIHLTNNAVQKYGENYGKHESGNIISLDELGKYLPQDKPGVSLEGIKKRIKELIRMTMESVRTKLNPSKRKSCFELFGYDFILDAEFNVWVIEVNSNPSIEESNELLNMLVPRMIDDALRLTVDKVFVPNLKNFGPEEAAKEGVEKEFPVRGYTNQENLWEHLINLKEPAKLKAETSQ